MMRTRTVWIDLPPTPRAGDEAAFGAEVRAAAGERQRLVRHGAQPVDLVDVVLCAHNRAHMFAKKA